MRKDREEHCVIALEWRPEGSRSPGRSMDHGEGWWNMKEKQLSGSHGRMSEPSQHIVVGRKRMSKPYVPYGMQRYRIGFLTDHSLPPGRTSKFGLGLFFK